MSRPTDLQQANRSVVAALYQAMRSLRLQGARSRMTEDAVATAWRPRHEARESQGELALRRLYPRLDGAGADRIGDFAHVRGGRASISRASIAGLRGELRKVERQQ